MSSEFPAVGDAVLKYVGGGRTSKPRGKMAAKNTMGRGSSPTGTTGKRPGYKIQEANGPRCYVSATLYRPNAAEASAQQRNVRIVPSATGYGDFWKKRQFGSVY